MKRIKDRVDRMRSTRARLDRQHRRIADLERELIRVSPQLAALEQRVEALRQRVSHSAGYEATPEEEALAGSLVEEIRTEHARVRARISAAVVFEERLRVLEERVEGMSA